MATSPDPAYLLDLSITGPSKFRLTPERSELSSFRAKANIVHFGPQRQRQAAQKIHFAGACLSMRGTDAWLQEYSLGRTRGRS
jgi:hypothetical protein